MKQFKLYIVEKLKINKDVNKSKINKKDFEYKFEGLTLGDFFKWYTNLKFEDIKDDYLEEFIDNSTLIKVYYNKNLLCCELPKSDFMRLKYTLSKHVDEKIELYQKYISPNAMYNCTFELSFLNKPVTFYSNEIYTGKCDIKYNL